MKGQYYLIDVLVNKKAQMAIWAFLSLSNIFFDLIQILPL